MQSQQITKWGEKQLFSHRNTYNENSCSIKTDIKKIYGIGFLNIYIF